MMLRAVILSLAIATSLAGSPLQLHPDVGLNVTQMIQRHGYPVEIHPNIETEDGYLLQLHRIPHGRNSSGVNRVPVLMMHCLACSSVDFINGGPGNSLAYALADLGYDVWLGNARGNEWGRKHKTLDPDVDKKQFWNYSVHEIGMYDLPATINHILAKTGVEKIFYVGHSQGTVAFWVMASSRPEFNDKIVMMSAMAPVAYSQHIPNPFLHLVAQFEQNIDWVTNMLGLHEFLPNSKLSEIVGKYVCNDDSKLQDVCSTFMFLICGFDPEQFNGAILPVVLTNIPSGTSTKQFIHFAQFAKSGLFRQFDYHKKNIEIYGQTTPPEYDTSKITVPVALHYAQNDLLSSVVDVQRLRDELPNVVLDNKVAYEKFNHLDFLWAKDVYNIVYKDVIAKMQDYNKQ